MQENTKTNFYYNRFENRQNGQILLKTQIKNKDK